MYYVINGKHYVNRIKFIEHNGKNCGLVRIHVRRNNLSIPKLIWCCEQVCTSLFIYCSELRRCLRAENWGRRMSWFVLARGRIKSNCDPGSGSGWRTVFWASVARSANFRQRHQLIYNYTSVILVRGGRLLLPRPWTQNLNHGPASILSNKYNNNGANVPGINYNYVASGRRRCWWRCRRISASSRRKQSRIAVPARLQRDRMCHGIKAKIPRPEAY